ncbi:hypothetical protein [Clostridium intestinale]|uniref:hypothetical protein n=1 Tax=Clostridium intestinale TaxID=36845 RepID=UPI002DD69766|nr:hypothetical protein [Clostridium intestinale]WRY53943.1 hypothetical protein P8F83_12190 [Clostridium intestinale]
MNQFDKELERINHKNAIKELNDSLDMIIENIKIHSQVQKAYFDELVKAGFTEVQALEIVKAHGVDTGRASRLNKGNTEEE